ncbi:unnamed protein product [Moneuplotes crassus]|uniref:Uncharacterized protein n=1 Tax=Euplotes crassus TaxID=5936 RepID=A0AAD2CZ48_EUPCR|nr:unnamed protein product [Moneuplotes crassus]
MATNSITADKLLFMNHQELLELEISKNESYDLKSCEIDEDDITINEIFSKETNDNPLVASKKVNDMEPSEVEREIERNSSVRLLLSLHLFPIREAEPEDEETKKNKRHNRECSKEDFNKLACTPSRKQRKRLKMEKKKLAIAKEIIQNCGFKSEGVNLPSN